MVTFCNRILGEAKRVCCDRSQIFRIPLVPREKLARIWVIEFVHEIITARTPRRQCIYPSPLSLTVSVRLYAASYVPSIKLTILKLLRLGKVLIVSESSCKFLEAMLE